VEGSHKLTGVENLVHKESDRLSEVIKLAGLFDRKISTDGKILFLEGKVGRVNKTIDLNMPDDHRMVMAGSLFLLHHGGGTIGPKGAVSKSYPEFFEIISF
jgi:5-enolpyruvylshikimate-3-phosphate synthase